ncbi:c-type cytochrome [Roseibium sediminis]|uniref:c-type cytochrome n=1 Tax=Roseibium sediminis TaxID=1775174 RepID=UPI001FCCBF93|nr:c-type cytochrome [Roseibium sediminis]
MNKVRSVLTIGAALCLMGTGLSLPAHAADEANGKALALKWCAACHVVAEDQDIVSGASLPSFFDVANGGAYTEESLKTFLADPHPKMPDMALTNFEIADLARYILSLKED